MKQALVDIEDSRFYEHGGLDVEGTLRALARNVAAGSVVEGGSTITQQLVKQSLLQAAVTADQRAAATEESVGRKLREARLALALEQQSTKAEILTRYLNIVYFGRGAYGVQAAAQRYFSVNAADLTLPQAAMLAGLVQQPGDDDPITNPEAALERRNQVLERMHDLGHITDQELDATSALPVAVAASPPPPNGCVESIAGFFCDFLQRYLTQTLGVSQEQLENGGLTITTTLRPHLQATGDRAVRAAVAPENPVAAIFTAVEPGTGEVMAMSVNRRFGYDANDPAQESVNLSVEASQGAGSTYKVFVAAAALESGIPPWHTITTTDPYVSRVYKNGEAPYVVRNVGRIPPTLSMIEALIRSSNTYFVALSDQLGSIEGPVRMAQRMGLFSLDPVADKVISENRGSFALGVGGHQPAGARQRVLDPGGERHAVRSDPRRLGGRRRRRAADRGRRYAAEHPPRLQDPGRAAGRGHHAEPDPGRGHGPPDRHRHPCRDPRSPDRREDGHEPGAVLRRLRRLHAEVRRQRHAAQSEAEPGHRRLRRPARGPDLARRDAADPVRGAGHPVPAGRPAAQEPPGAPTAPAAAELISPTVIGSAAR